MEEYLRRYSTSTIVITAEDVNLVTNLECTFSNPIDNVVLTIPFSKFTKTSDGFEHRLTQEEAGNLAPYSLLNKCNSYVYMQVRYLLSGGVSGATEIKRIELRDVLKGGVLSA